MAQPTPQQWADLAGEDIDAGVWIHGGPLDEPELTLFGFEANIKWVDWIAFAHRILEQQAK